MAEATPVREGGGCSAVAGAGGAFARAQRSARLAQAAFRHATAASPPTIHKGTTQRFF